MGVYSIVSISCGRKYIGKSLNLKQRWISHKSLLRRNVHPSLHLQRAWNKYGEGNFKFEIVEFVEDANILLKREQHWINFYRVYLPKNGYNSRIVADSNAGWKQTDASKKRISDKLKLRKFSDTHRKNISLSKLGKKLSTQHLEKFHKHIHNKQSIEMVRKRVEAHVIAVKNWSDERRLEFALKMLAKRTITIASKQREKCERIKKFTKTYFDHAGIFPNCNQISKGISIPQVTVWYLGNRYGFDNLGIQIQKVKGNV